MLGELYAASYPRKDRKKLGNYDTPLYIARRILDNIPLEYLRPEERVVADFTCGWGSFLIASQERLSKLSDSDEVPLQRCIYGNDHDKFFTQLARLGLMYTTTKDDWHVDNYVYE
jgi:type I restriction-modification system DNA methylase subunit